MDQAQGLSQDFEGLCYNTLKYPNTRYVYNCVPLSIGVIQELTNENERLTERIKQLGERVDQEVARVHQLEEEKVLHRRDVNQLKMQCEAKTEEIRELQHQLGVSEHRRHASLPAQTLSQYVCSGYL